MSLDTTKILTEVNYKNTQGEISSYTSSNPKALVKPAIAPISQSIVSIDTNNEQQNLTLGNGLSISNTDKYKTTDTIGFSEAKIYY